ncbi:MAG: alpha/beta hydrolase [Tidjanibacter sp.]|nr:alpha/beta hydrolase [Tidjanibacter sp.]
MKRITLIVLLFALTVIAAGAKTIEKCTYRFAADGDRELYLDLYKSSDTIQPCVIYAFGGGFAAGTRAEKFDVRYYKYLVSQGFKVVAVDYRLGLKPLVDNPTQKVELTDFRSMLINAVDMATEDFLDATAYVVANAESLGVDPSKIVACGSSAGAITVYQSEYEICNLSEAAKVLPEGFNYAGVVGFAGAVLAKSGKFAFKSAPCPMLLFHGNADSNVPYDKMSLFGYSFYGSQQIVKQLNKTGATYWFYDADNVDHSLAGTPMSRNREEISTFLNRVVLGGKKLQVHQTVVDTTLPEAKKRFKIGDYIKANFYRPDPSVSRQIVAAGNEAN